MVNKDTPILITGSGGFIGKNLVATLKSMGYTNLLCFDVNTNPALLAEYAAGCGFVFHLAGINRPKTADEFYKGNGGLTEQILSLLENADNKCPVLVTSSSQAALDNDYGKSKVQAEKAMFAHAQKSGARVCVYRLPGVFGKWCRPNYNSVVATFCHNVANGLPIEVRDESYTFPLVYIDDVVRCFINSLNGTDEKDGEYCTVSPVHTVTLGRLARLVNEFKQSRESLMIPNMQDEFSKKLYSTYLSYLPKNEFGYPVKMNVDSRGSFTELFKSNDRGQVSVNISKPGITKGNHWHHTKNEKFAVVSGKGLIRFRKLGEEDIIDYHVSGDEIRIIDIPTGYTHNIINEGDTDLVTIMWCNECFDANNPDTIFEQV